MLRDKELEDELQLHKVHSAVQPIRKFQRTAQISDMSTRARIVTAIVNRISL